MKYKLVIIGGGAAGMMAAISASRIIPGEEIVLVEKNPDLGKKIAATGNGRCNFSNRFCQAQDYGGSIEHAEGVFRKLSPADTVKLWSELGILAREEGGGRLYPYSEQARSVIAAMEDELRSKNVNILLSSKVKNVYKKGQVFHVDLEEANLQGQMLILATGGKAGHKFGSTGDGYGFAKGFGHSLVRPLPGLVQILTEEKSFKNLKGVRSKGIVSLKKADQLIGMEEGEIQFTGKGLSGICIFNLSRHLGEKASEFHIEIDLFPGFPLEEVSGLLRDKRVNMKDRTADSFLRGMLKEKLIASYLEMAGINVTTMVGQVDEHQLLELAKLLKCRRVAIKGTEGWVEAQVTVGGVNCKEVSADTLESSLVAGLFFAGELLDVDGKCGGWNLQWAWSSGWTAGFYAGNLCL